MPLFSQEKSKIKMVIMLKNGNDSLKLKDSNGQLSCPVQYSIISKNKKPLDQIIRSMVKRFKAKNKMASQTNCLIFIDQTTNQQIHRENL